MSWREWLSVSLPCGFVTSGDIGLSNLSLVTITITFYTMVKASTPIFVLGWAYLFGIERITWTLLLVVFIIAVGEFMTVLGEVEFDEVGFLMCLGASILSGARWTLVQLKLQSMEPRLKTTIATMRLLAPSMFFSMLFVALLVERPWVRLAGYSLEETIKMFGLGLFGAFFAISMILCEFYLVLHASAIILMIGGVIKEMITIFVGVVFFGDPLNLLNVMGCLVVFMGVIVYKVSYHLNKSASEDEMEHLSDRGSSLADSRVEENLQYTHVDSGEDDAEDLYGNDRDWNDAIRDISEEGIRSRENGIELRKQQSEDVAFISDKMMT
jgi:solute carrier family 35 protein C2